MKGNKRKCNFHRREELLSSHQVTFPVNH